ncbi:hypothetical protein AB4090_05695 [Acidithiobacillus sp. IBUN Pt1247-S3]|uniref:hypothetical protein n=1 Tax=Acidithiobacillus sp. IBUN Pt1247-S3 TaxID=3166642 RepID=UPI0034E61CA1
MASTLQPHSVPPGWFVRWSKESWALQKEAPVAFTFLSGLLILLNLSHQPLILTIPFACLETALIFATAMAVELGSWQIRDLLLAFRDLPWLPLIRLGVALALLVFLILLLLWSLHHYLQGILVHDHISSAATLKNLHTHAWESLPLWLKNLLSNSLGNAQTLLGNVFLMLSVGAVVLGLARQGYLALLAGFLAVLRNVRIWLVFLLASLLLQGAISYLANILHQPAAAALVAALSVMLLLWVGLFGWCFAKETFGLPKQRQTQRQRVRKAHAVPSLPH